MTESGEYLFELPVPQPYPVRLPLPDRLVVIGDLNGHDRLLDSLLFGTGLIDEYGDWSGGDTILVQMGDVLNRGRGSRAAAERLISIRPQAQKGGGEVIWMLGNHEVMTALGHEGYVTADEYMEFADSEAIDAFYRERARFMFELLGPPDRATRVEPIGGRMQAWDEANAPGKLEFREAFSSRGLLGLHVRSLPVVLGVGPLVFAHGGLSPQWAKLGLEGLSRAAQDVWSAQPQAYQILDPNGIFRDPLGPLWHRMYCISDAPPIEEDAAVALKSLGADRMIVGHTRTESAPGGESGQPLLRQDGRVLMVDVGIGDPGEPGCVIIIEDGHIDMWSPIHGRCPVCPVARE